MPSLKLVLRFIASVFHTIFKSRRYFLFSPIICVLFFSLCACLAREIESVRIYEYVAHRKLHKLATCISRDFHRTSFVSAKSYVKH